MDFDIEDLVSSAVGAISEVADEAYDAVTSLFDGSDSDDSGTYSEDSSDSGDDSDDSGDDSDGADSEWDDSGLDYNSIESLFGGVPISADIDEDGGFDIGDVEEFCEDKFKVLVGAFIGSEELQEQSDEMTQEGISQDGSDIWGDLVGSEEMQEQSDEMTQQGIDQLGNDITQGADNIWNTYVYGEELQEQSDEMEQEEVNNNLAQGISYVENGVSNSYDYLKDRAEETYKDFLPKSGTKAIGAGVNAGFGIVVGASGQFVVDKDGNWDVQVTFSAGGGTPTAGASIFESENNASQISDNTGGGRTVGGSIGVGYDQNLSDSCTGETVSLALGTDDILPEIHADLTDTFSRKDAVKNVENEIDKIIGK